LRDPVTPLSETQYTKPPSPFAAISTMLTIRSWGVVGGIRDHDGWVDNMGLGPVDAARLVAVLLQFLRGDADEYRHHPYRRVNALPPGKDRGFPPYPRGPVQGVVIQQDDGTGTGQQGSIDPVGKLIPVRQRGHITPRPVTSGDDDLLEGAAKAKGERAGPPAANRGRVGIRVRTVARRTAAVANEHFSAFGHVGR